MICTFFRITIVVHTAITIQACRVLQNLQIPVVQSYKVTLELEQLMSTLKDSVELEDDTY
jgi:hypothetical protein